MANVDYDQPNPLTGGLGDMVYAEPEPGTVYLSKCHHCGYHTYLADGDARSCPVCSGQTGLYSMSFEGARIHVAALNAAQLQQLRNQRNHHRELCNREIARGQIAKEPGNMTAMETMQRQAAIQTIQQQTAIQLGMIAQQAQGPAWVGNECKIKANIISEKSAKEQERAVTHELMDALDYLLSDIADNMRRHPHLEAIGRNWAMRRARAALEHGRAML